MIDSTREEINSLADAPTSAHSEPAAADSASQHNLEQST